jgi:NAD(P)-dependent dehydrogenase (short-subunit alcohol dehydrogenase family)
MRRVQGKVAVVTGGARGIGRTVCLLLAQEGAKVAVADILDEAGEAVASEVMAAGGEARFWHMDVTNAARIAEVFREVRDAFGKIDVLVNDAGILGPDKPTHEITEAEFDQTFAVNVKGVFLCTKHVIPHMRAAGGGAIVDLSSTFGLVGGRELPTYHASKGAVRLMAKTDAVLYADEGIRVNSVHPGNTLTPMLENEASNAPGGRDENLRIWAQVQPMQHLAQPEDIAWGIIYLVSDEAKYVTGAELVIDGGFTAQ